MGSLVDIANEVLNATQVMTDASNAAAGSPVHVSVIPGLSPQIPMNFSVAETITGTLNGTLGTLGQIGGTLTGPITGELDALIHPVTVTVKYSLTRDGNAVAQADFTATPALSAMANVSDPLNVAFLLKPPLGDDTELTEPFHYVISVSINVDVDGNMVSKSIDIPVDMPALEIPAIFLLASNQNFGIYDGDTPGSVLVMVRAASPLRELDAVVAAINRVMRLLKALQGVLGWVTTAFDSFSGDLSLIPQLISSMPTVFLSVGNAGDFGASFSFDNAARCSLLIGIAASIDANNTRKGTWVTVYNDENFPGGGVLNIEHSVFQAEDVGTTLGLVDANGNPIKLGVGVDKRMTFGNWDTDSNESMDKAMESARFGAI